MEVKDKSLSQLIKTADEVFSKYIRRRDANPQNPFYLNCFTCGKAERIEFAHCMHYIPRDKMATRYDEMNAHGGCEHCNCFDPDHYGRYYSKMVTVYGAEKVNNLIWQSRSLQKFARFELVELIDTYREKLKKLKS